MKQIDTIAMYRKMVFTIVDGPYKGKNCFISEINFEHETITTKTGTVIPAELVRPNLRAITDLGDVESQFLYKEYWGNSIAQDWTGDTGSANFMPKKVKPTKQHVLRIFEGKDYIAGDWEELMRITPFMIEGGFDIFNLAAKGWAIIKNRYDSVPT